jgi:GNAT superfamily N-acetyltransferase
VRAGDVFAYDEATTREEVRKLWTPAHVASSREGSSAPTTSSPTSRGAGRTSATPGNMVSASARGRGVGRAMGEHSIVEARRLGYRAMQYNFVVATNLGALALWEKLGVRGGGTVPQAFPAPPGGTGGRPRALPPAVGFRPLRSDDLHTLPADLPVPSGRRGLRPPLPGMAWPALALPSTGRRHGLPRRGGQGGGVARRLRLPAHRAARSRSSGGLALWDAISRRPRLHAAGVRLPGPPRRAAGAVWPWSTA